MLCYFCAGGSLTSLTLIPFLSILFLENHFVYLQHIIFFTSFSFLYNQISLTGVSLTSSNEAKLSSVMHKTNSSDQLSHFSVACEMCHHWHLSNLIVVDISKRKSKCHWRKLWTSDKKGPFLNFALCFSFILLIL